MAFGGNAHRGRGANGTTQSVSQEQLKMWRTAVAATLRCLRRLYYASLRARKARIVDNGRGRAWSRSRVRCPERRYAHGGVEGDIASPQKDINYPKGSVLWWKDAQTMEDDILKRQSWCEVELAKS